MLKNYFKVAWRSLRRSKATSFINIGGLAVGMGVAMLVGLWIYDELKFDTYHENYDRLAQVYQHQTINGSIASGPAIPMPLRQELGTKYSENFKALTMASWMGDHILSYGDNNFSKTGIYMEPEGPKMFTLKMVEGNRDGLRDMNSILLSSSAALAIFGTESAIGKSLQIDNKMPVKVTGVFQDLPRNTTFKNMEFIAPWQLYAGSEQWLKESSTEWGNNSFQLFAQIADNSNFDTVNKHILHAKYNQVAPDEKKFKAQIVLQPMQNWHLRSHWENGRISGGQIEYVWLFGIIGIFVLLLACINFMNLSTARSEKRSREVGIRKAVGSMRGQLIRQFYVESLLVVTLAFAVSLLLVALCLPWFNKVSAKSMELPFRYPVFWISSIAFIGITGFIAGSYPALYLSSFKPVKVLKGSFRAGRFASLPRKGLVVLQFTISLALIVGTVIVYTQIQYTKNRPIGYNRDGLMMIQMKSHDFDNKFDVLKNELTTNGAITEIAESSSPLTAVWSNNGGFTWEGKDPSLNGDFATIWVTHEYGKAVGWNFTAGRDFSRQFGTDTAAIVLNEAAVKFMSLTSPVGKTVKWGDGPSARILSVVGVIKDMVMQSPYDPVKRTIYLMGYKNANWIILKLNPEKSARESIAKIEAAFKKYIPSAPFDYKFADDVFAAKFAAEERIGKLASAFSILAVFISCLGLFGLAAYATEQRKKEIGIRKVLGATVANLWGLLSKEFLLLVVISWTISIPITAWLMHNWLLKYEYHTSLSWLVFALSGAGTLILTMLTVSYQAIRAAISDPVKSLRTE